MATEGEGGINNEHGGGSGGDIASYQDELPNAFIWPTSLRSGLPLSYNTTDWLTDWQETCNKA